MKEILRAGGFHHGQQTELKRALRELVRRGELRQDGKRYGLPEVRHEKKSGPAWGPGVSPKHAKKAEARTPKAKAAPAKKPRGRPASYPTQGPVVEGIVHHHPDGFAFVKPLKDGTEDVFLPPEQARRALDHDRVRVEVVKGRGGRSAGRLLDVTSRTRQLVVGTYYEGPKGAWVEPREAELGRIHVPKTQLARAGDAVKVRLGVGTQALDVQRALVGEVAGSLGSPDDHSVEVLTVAYAKGFQDEFPPEVMDESDRFALEVTEAEAKGERRRDLRKLPLVTIDGEDARDFDDAIYAEKDGTGWRLVVAIADVSHYVREDSALNAEALRRATSVYLPGRVLPMLPERLSNGICSLKPNEDRLCMVADLRVGADGVTSSAEIYPAVMCSAARCTYTEVHRVLSGESAGERQHLKPRFLALHEVAQALNVMRMKRGAVDFDLPETRIELDPKGLPARLVQRERHESHRLVEECMLAANEAVARFFRERELPTVNRYHAEPDEERLGAFLTLLGAHGFQVLGERVTSAELNRLLKELEGHPEQRALHQLALRSMMQARYSANEAGHYGLGAPDYLHFTSPIRRYPDLLVHRLLKQHWKNDRHARAMKLEHQIESLEAMATQASERERAAMQVEREVTAFYACLLMKDHVGEEFAATVCGLSEHGFYVQLDEWLTEGLVRGETVFPDFEFDEGLYRLTFGNGRTVKVGMKAKVRLLSVNLKKKQMDFAALELEGTSAERPRRAGGGDDDDGGWREPRRRKGGRGKDARQGRQPEDRKAYGLPDRETHKRSWREERHRAQRQPPSFGEKPRQNHPGWKDAGERKPHRAPQPPEAQGQAGPPEPGAPGGRFDARQVLDRLWAKRAGPGGGGQGGRDRDERGGGRDFQRGERGGGSQRHGPDEQGGQERGDRGDWKRSSAGARGERSDWKRTSGGASADWKRVRGGIAGAKKGKGKGKGGGGRR